LVIFAAVHFVGCCCRNFFLLTADNADFADLTLIFFLFFVIKISVKSAESASSAVEKNLITH
jgi:hypothetical protein